MPAPIQTYSQPSEFNLVDLDPAAGNSTVVNGVTIVGKFNPSGAKWAVAVSTVGRAPEMTFSFSGSVPTQTAADALCRNLVDLAYDLAAALPPPPA